MKKQQLLEKLNGLTTDFPNAQLSVTDVIKLVSDLQENNVDLVQLKDDIINKVNGIINDIAPDDVINFDSAEFEIGYGNKLTLEHVDIDIDNILTKVEGIIEEEFDVISK